MNQELHIFFSKFVGTLGIVLVFILLISNKSNKIVNRYLSIVLLIISYRSISSVLDTDKIIAFKYINESALNSISLVVMPSFFLYIESIIKGNTTFNKMKILHFILPVFLFFYFLFLNNPKYLYYNLIIYTFQFFVILFISYYFVKIISIYYKYYHGKKKDIDSKVLPNSTKKWIRFLLFIAILMIIRILIVLIFETYTNTNFSGHSISIIQSLLILFIYLKILRSPEILYGFPKLTQQISKYNEEKINNISIWKIPGNKTTNLQDKALKNKINKKVNKYILAIDEFVENKNPFRVSKYSLSELANDLNIPSSHLNYIFKYHCEISFVEYKNYSKINDSINLINSNFLEFKTLESLASKVGFNSYNSFFIYFKKQSNLSPREYCKS